MSEAVQFLAIGVFFIVFAIVVRYEAHASPILRASRAPRLLRPLTTLLVILGTLLIALGVLTSVNG